MSVSLTITDNGDATGLATIAGTLGGNVTLYKAVFAGGTLPITWTLVNTRVGDGTIALAGVGYFLWRVEVFSAGIYAGQATAYQPISSITALGVEARLLDAVVAKVTALALPGLPSGRIRRQWIPRKLTATDACPFIAVCPYGSEDFPTGMNNTIDIGFPVVVAICDALNADYLDTEDAINTRTLWRELINRGILRQQVPGVPEGLTPRPVSSPVFSLDFAERTNLFFSPVSFLFSARLGRIGG